MTLSINNIQHDSHYAERLNAECRVSFIVMLNVITLGVVAPVAQHLLYRHSLQWHFA
jgi:hypothetical protein